jgi:hypothetical protein
MIIKPRRLWLADINVKLEKALVEAVFKARKDAWDELLDGGYKKDGLHDLYAPTVRCKLDLYLAQLAVRFPNWITSTSNPNVSHNYFHVLLNCKRVSFTASAVDSPDDIPREAKYRQEYILTNQLSFTISKDNRLAPDGDFSQLEEAYKQAKLYAVLVHGSSDSGLPFHPGFIKIVFPDKYNNRLDDSIDLMGRYNKIASKIIAKDIEQINDEIKVKLKRPVTDAEQVKDEIKVALKKSNSFANKEEIQ